MEEILQLYCRQSSFSLHFSLKWGGGGCTFFITFFYTYYSFSNITEYSFIIPFGLIIFLNCLLHRYAIFITGENVKSYLHLPLRSCNSLKSLLQLSNKVATPRMFITQRERLHLELDIFGTPGCELSFFRPWLEQYGRADSRHSLSLG